MRMVSIHRFMPWNNLHLSNSLGPLINSMRNLNISSCFHSLWINIFSLLFVSNKKLCWNIHSKIVIVFENMLGLKDVHVIWMHIGKHYTFWNAFFLIQYLAVLFSGIRWEETLRNISPLGSTQESWRQSRL